MKAIIIGGGVGGLTTALMLHARGIDCEVFEQADAVRELGVGINTLPHAIRELKELGLLERLDAVAIRTHELFYANRFGQTVWHELRGLEAGFDVPQFSIHRGKLQGVIYQAARARLGEGKIHTGHRLGSFTQDEGGVSAFFFDRSGSHIKTARGDVLIGADGIHSFVREALFPKEGPALWNGTMLWRGAVDWPQFMTGRSMIIAGHRDQKIVAYPMLTLPDGRVQMNWIAELGRPGAPPREDWNRRVDKSVFAAPFSSWNFDWLDVPAMIDATDVSYEFPKIDRNPVERWTFGRVTLAGDAAHPMHPVGSQAGSQAVVDGRVLAWHLATCKDPLQALQRYQDERLPAMRDITLGNRTLGPEVVMQIVEERAPDGFTNLHDILPPAELASRAAEFKEKAGFAIEALNRRASYSVR